MIDPDVMEEVRQRYAVAAIQSSCCEPGNQECGFGADLYQARDLQGIPVHIAKSSLGCGNPMTITDLHEGEIVLDLGSGGGLDVLLSAQRVGPTGFAFGVDMTDEMLDVARKHAAEMGVSNVEFLKGTIEELPLQDSSVDVVISNCVINLSTDKPTVLTEIYRVLKPGGRIGVSDVVAEDQLSRENRAQRGSHVGCIAGALSKMEYVHGLTATGFVQVEVTFTHEVAPQMHAAIIKAVKPV